MSDIDGLMPAEGTNVPCHIGIIMDGNGRWAKKRGLLRFNGHKEGAKVFTDICKYANRIGVKYLTVYAFSTENWKRPKREVNAIMDLLRTYLKDAENNKEENIRTRFIGDLAALPADIISEIKRVEDSSKDFTGMTLMIAVNYGGRNEIVHAAKTVAEKIAKGEMDLSDLNEDSFQAHLYTTDAPAVDLVIRPSGEMRLSNFMIWQCAYAEYVFRDVLWPDFRPKDLLDCIYEYNNRNRRFGGV